VEAWVVGEVDRLRYWGVMVVEAEVLNLRLVVVMAVEAAERYSLMVAEELVELTMVVKEVEAEPNLRESRQRWDLENF
jgi:hypothetical protein